MVCGKEKIFKKYKSGFLLVWSICTYGTNIAVAKNDLKPIQVQYEISIKQFMMTDKQIIFIVILVATSIETH